MRKTMLAALASVAFVLPASAQETGQAGQECQQLADYLRNDNDLSRTGLNEQQVQNVVTRGEAQTCGDVLRLAGGDISRDQADPNFDADASARIRLAIPEPEVTVDQAAPDVTVEQRPPQVNVNTGRPVVTVQQSEPTVNVTVPPPRVTIDMPKPRIVVEMPDPSVDVRMVQPRVTVDQPQPTVNVEQGEVELQVTDTQSVTDEAPDQSQVVVEQANPNVNVRQPDQAQVDITELRPEVRYEAAEPRVNIEQTGEPQIQFTQTGEPQVEFRQMTAEQTRAAAQRTAGMQAEGQTDGQMAAADATAEPAGAADQVNRPAGAADQSAATEATPAPAPQTDQMAAAPPANQAQETPERTGTAYMESTQQTDTTAARQAFTVAQIMDMDVIGAGGEQLGDIEAVIQYDGQTYVVIAEGGFLGIGEDEIALPLADMVVRGNQLVMRQITEEDLDGMRDIDVDNYTNLQDNQQVELVAGG